VIACQALAARPVKRAAAVTVLAVLLTACGSSSSGGQTYKTATQVIEALNTGGMNIQCDSPDSPAGQTVVRGAMSENQCNLASNSSETFFVDVFPGTVSKSKLLANSVSTGDEQMFSVLGPNWWVLTDATYVHQVQKILGGMIVPGIWHPDTGN
jgi:hypothetical protein